MANILANANGNWHTGSTWVGGVVPGPSDVAYLNNRAITVAATVTCAAISSRAENGATAGGSLSLNDGLTINASLRAGTTAMITMANSTTLTVVGEVEGGSGSNLRCITVGVNCTLNVTGRVLAGSVNGANGIYCASTGALITVVGDCIGSATSTASAIVNTSTGSIYITGTVTGGSNTNAFGVANSGSGLLDITGSAVGGNSATSHGVNNTGSGTVNIHGIAEGGVGGSSGANNTSNGVIIVTKAKGNAYGNESAPPLNGAGVGASNVGQNGAIYVSQIEFGALGMSPVSGTGICLTDSLTNVCLMRRVGTTHKPLVDPLNVDGLVPDPGDVRSGVAYGYGDIFGYLQVPPPEAVAAGVPVGDGYGLAMLTGADVWNVLMSEITNPNSIGMRLKDTATTAITAQLIADALTGD